MEFDDTAPGFCRPGNVFLLNAVVEGDAVGEGIAGEGGEVALLPVEVAIEPETTDGKGICDRKLFNLHLYLLRQVSRTQVQQLLHPRYIGSKNVVISVQFFCGSRFPLSH